jgi:hypothetical protein
MKTRPSRREIGWLCAAFVASLFWLPLLIVSNVNDWLDRIPTPLVLPVVYSVPFGLLFLSLQRFRHFSTPAIAGQLLAILAAGVMTVSALFGGYFLHLAYLEVPKSRSLEWYRRWRAARLNREYQQRTRERWNQAPSLAPIPIETGTLKASFAPSFHPSSKVEIRSDKNGGTVALEVNGHRRELALAAETVHQLFRKLSEIHRLAPDEATIVDGCGVDLQFTSAGGQKIFEGSGNPTIPWAPTEFAITRITMDLIEQLDWPPAEREYIDQVAGYFPVPEPTP